MKAHPNLKGVGMFKATIEFNVYYYQLKRLSMDRLLRAIRFQGGKVLDVGTGVGFWVRYFLERGCHVEGVDLVPEVVDSLKGQFPQAKFYLADVSRWVPPKKYELVNAYDVLFHIVNDESWESALKNLWTAVKPGGHFLLTDAWNLGAGRFSDSEHVMFRGSQHYLKVLKEAKLRATVPIYYLFGAPLSLKGLERRLVARCFRLVRRVSKKPSLAKSITPLFFNAERVLTGLGKGSSTYLVALEKPV